jgi:hypothetical protein
MPGVNLIWDIYYNTKFPHASAETRSFWWKDLLRLNILFRGIARCEIGDGAIVTFWEDIWAGEILAYKFPRLFSYARNDSTSVEQIMKAEDLDSIFHLPLSQEAFDEMLQLQDHLSGVQYDQTGEDTWTFIWGNLYKTKAWSIPRAGAMSTSPINP